MGGAGRGGGEGTPGTSFFPERCRFLEIPFSATRRTENGERNEMFSFKGSH